MGFKITKWYGPDINTRIKMAAKVAIDQTTEAAAQSASTNHWWRNRSGLLASEILHDPAVIRGNKISGRFGSTRDAFYGLFLERRTPFLRPAADKEFKLLSKRIKMLSSMWERR